MSFKRVRHNTGEEIFELIISDGNGLTLGKWKVMKEDFKKVVEIVSRQYGLDIMLKNPFRDYNKNKDLEWAGL